MSKQKTNEPNMSPEDLAAFQELEQLDKEAKVLIQEIKSQQPMADMVKPAGQSTHHDDHYPSKGGCDIL